MLSILNKILDKKIKVAVHSGKFHPDDVSAVAILSLYLNKPIKIFRSRDPKVWAKCDYVFDVGGEYKPEENKFDHHQESFTMKRENGIKFSSASLAWKHFGEKVAGSKEIWKIIDEEIIQTFDADDNGIELFKSNYPGVRPYCFTDYIYSLEPTPMEKEEYSTKFFEKAVEIMKHLLQREIKVAQDRLLSSKAVENIYKDTKDKRIIIFNNNYYWKDVIANHPEPLFVIVPRLDTNTWAVVTVKLPGSQFDNRLDLPLTWAGKRDKDLADITGVPDALFCHKERFIAGAKSKEGAIALAKLALNQNKN